MRTLVKYLFYKFIHLFYKGLRYKDLLNSSLRSVLKLFLIQKICRINSNVNWQVHPTSTILSPEKINRGKNFRCTSKYCHLDGRNGIVFGENVWIGPSVKIISQNHNPSNYSEYLLSDQVIIGDNCWIGSGAIILPGVHLGSHTIVAAGSVVTKSFLSQDQLVAGNPAVIKKQLTPYFNIK